MKSKHRGPSRFRKTEATRAVKAMLDAGLSVSHVEINPATGVITVIPGTLPNDKPTDRNEWDDEFNGSD